MVLEWKPMRIPTEVFDDVEAVQKHLQQRSIGKVTLYQAISIAISTSSILHEVKR